MIMSFHSTTRAATAAVLALALAGCGGGGSGLFGGGNRAPAATDAEISAAQDLQRQNIPGADTAGQSTIWDLFGNADDPNTTVEVNKYLWQASLEILDFLPIQSVDPFSGVIVTGYGTPPGGGRAYRATVYVQDPALDARSLKVALATRSGPVSTATVRAVEDAILTRARQLRIRDGKL